MRVTDRAINIWRAGTNDAQALVTLERAAFEARSWGAEGVRESLAAPKVEILFAGWALAEPLGFSIWRNLGEDAEILTIGVSPQARRAGLARALLAHSLDAARRQGCARMFLEVDRENAAAVGLYANAGFVPVGKRSRYYRDGADALVMRADL